FEHRLAVQAKDTGEACTAVSSWLAGRPSASSYRRINIRAEPVVAFLFSGQGSQYAGMGRELYETQPVFRSVIDECDALLRAHQGVSVREIMWGAETACLDRTDYTQPAIFALETALGRLWLSWGVVPRIAIGHSVGEYAAAHLAGAFSLQ